MYEIIIVIHTEIVTSWWTKSVE